MNSKEKIEYLKSYKNKKERLEFVKNQIQCIQAVKYTPSISNPKKSLCSYIEEKTLLEEELKSIEECVKGVKDDKARFVLEYRFLEFIPLSQIPDYMSFSYSQIYRYYEKGLEMIEI